MIALMACSLAWSAHAVDGVIEINQYCAAGAGCFSGDSAGFPVQISSRGSYRLTSNLVPANQNTTLITITVAGVHLDLNGFTLQGANTFPGPGFSCSAPGSGVGVSGGANQVVVTNGFVLGMGSSGVDLGTAGAGCSVERVSAVNNCGVGIRVPLESLVRDSIAVASSSHGIVAGSHSRVVNSIAHNNGSDGIRSFADNSSIAVDGCASEGNGVDGLFVGERSQVFRCVASDNGDDGIAALAYSTVMESVANRNTDRGITVLGSLAAGTATALGLDVAAQNGGLDISGGTTIACTYHDNVVTCP